MVSKGKKEKEPICTIRSFVKANGPGVANGGFNYRSVETQANGNIANGKIANGTVNNGPNGSAKVPNGIANGAPNGTSNGALNGTANGAMNGTANGTANGAPNGTANGTANGAQNGSFFKHNGSSKNFGDEKCKSEDSVELDFSTSSLIESNTDAVVECTKNKS